MSEKQREMTEADIDPAWMIKVHTGYELDENDYHDVKLLCEKFGFQLPAEYDQFTDA